MVRSIVGSGSRDDIGSMTQFLCGIELVNYLVPLELPGKPCANQAKASINAADCLANILSSASNVLPPPPFPLEPRIDIKC